MLFRNAMRLLTENFKSVYKIALYKLVVFLVTTAIACAIILPTFTEIVNSAQMQALIADLKEFFTAIFAVDGDALAQVKEEIFGGNGTLHNVILLIGSKTAYVALVIVSCVLVYLVKRFVETLCYFAVGSMLNDKMTTYAETPFFTSYVANFGKASAYAAVYVPVVFLFDVLTLGIVFLLFYIGNVLAMLFFSVTLIVILQALKLTVTGIWMPAMTADHKPLRRAFSFGDKTAKKQLGKYYGTYIVAVYIVIVVNIVAALCTAGSALLLSLPASYMLFICLQYVYYYTIMGKKYFITYDRIASNPDRGDREHFFDYIDETASEKQTRENSENTEEY